MPSSIITSKGQITIPKEVRDTLGLETGDRLTFRLREDGVVELQPETFDVFALCGIIKPSIRGVTVEQMNAAIRKAGSSQ
jgi:AbrB family looped-hinge helix DNA binding protein